MKFCEVPALRMRSWGMRRPPPSIALLPPRSLQLATVRGPLLAALFCAGCWNQFDDPTPLPTPDDDSVAVDDDTSIADDDTSANDDDTSSSDDDTAVGDDDTSVADDDTSVADDDTAADDDTVSDDDTEVEGDDDTEVEDDDSSLSDDDSSLSDDDSAGDDDSSLTDDDSAGDDDSTGPCPTGVIYVDSVVTLTDPGGLPTTTLSIASPLHIELSLSNEGGQATTQYYGSNCLFQATLWDPWNNPVGGGRLCTPGLVVTSLVCGQPPVTDAWDLLPTYNLSPTVPLPAGPYTLSVDTYFYGTESFAVNVI